MTNVVLFAVLGSAVLHGIWNAIAKAIPNGLISSALISLSYLIIGGVLCLVLPTPPPEVWPYLVISALLQTVYLLLLTTAYSKMEFGMAYPITRGIAVLGVTVISVVWLGEKLGILPYIGIAVVVLSLFTLSWKAGKSPSGPRSYLPFILVASIGATVTAYSVMDGVGVRISGNPWSYAAWLFFFQGFTIPIAAFLLSKDKKRFLAGLKRHWLLGGVGGVLSIVSYTIVVWAQSVAPLGVVSALRETGVLAAAGIGYLVFKEPLTTRKVLATLGTLVGIVLIRLST